MAEVTGMTPDRISQEITSATDNLKNHVDTNLSRKADTTYVDNSTWIRPALNSSSNVDTLTSGLYPVPTNAIATALGMPYEGPGELVTTWLDSSGLRRRQTFYSDRIG